MSGNFPCVKVYFDINIDTSFLIFSVCIVLEFSFVSFLEFTLKILHGFMHYNQTYNVSL